MGHRNKWNKRIRGRIHGSVNFAMRLFYEGKRKEEQSLLDSVQSELREHTPWNGGDAWSREWDHYRNALEMLRRPCDCLFCNLTDEQRNHLKAVVDSKEEDLASVYADAESNFTGAYAEVVFGFRYGLPVNLVRGFDGGKDFKVACSSTASGVLTIDVKGTVHGRAMNGKMISYFPWIRDWIAREDHIYVLLQVSDRQHVFFRGFAFGNDKASGQIAHDGQKKYFLERPGPGRTLEELDTLLAHCQPLITGSESSPTGEVEGLLSDAGPQQPSVAPSMTPG